VIVPSFIASMAYSTWNSRPSGLNVLTPRSYSERVRNMAIYMGEHGVFEMGNGRLGRTTSKRHLSRDDMPGTMIRTTVIPINVRKYRSMEENRAPTERLSEREVAAEGGAKTRNVSRFLLTPRSLRSGKHRQCYLVYGCCAGSYSYTPVGRGVHCRFR